ncbi:fungal specific transcription factor domain-containing protein [Colletotrichum costaricense]|uniref:Fungal specific transcription factor domain-containing protein n=1 Tax=Colletotrichum costaricense TaxID=1209916 RepID=A0AAJ0E7K2_9PEZI|nr:fungal specific transcription factor domain-containing protein [Colletotrichum costaricense]KAK1538728.1 fungal specific transcription factor domain-containing protein [Colletotrichum costaricense]
MEHTQASPFLKPVITPKRKAQISTAPAASSQSVQQRQIEERSELAQAIQRSPDWSNGSLQPAGLFSRAATRGSFSLGSILNASESTTSEAQQEESRIPADDPIQLGLLNSSIASSLFENFMESLNPYISQLDPYLHTFSRTRQESSFLLTAILSAASKAFNPALYKRLRDHAEGILASTFRKGTKSVETAQAVMILTYWKESEDTRAWMLLGYVIRMGMELGWHRLAPYSPQSNAAMDLERRQARNIERTWLILFVYDRSLESLLAIIKSRIEEWESRWLRVADPAEASTVTDLPEHRDQLRAGERDTTREIGYAATSGRAFGQAEGALSLDFADDETWVGLMAEAGFNTQDGVFFA